MLLPLKKHFNLSTFVKNALKYSFVYVAVGLVIELTESNSFSVLIDLVKYHSTADQAVRKPRIHTQLFPDVLYAEGELFLFIQLYSMRGYESVFSLLLSRFSGCLPNLDFPDMFLRKISLYLTYFIVGVSQYTFFYKKPRYKQLVLDSVKFKKLLELHGIS